MLHPSRNHKHFPRLQNDVSVSQLYVQRAVYNEEQLVGILVRMPNEFAQQLSELDFVIIEGSDSALGPMVREAGKEMLEIERFHFRVGQGSSGQQRVCLD